jgi:hypothetical protein
VTDEYDYTEDEAEFTGFNWGVANGYCTAENEIEISAVVYTPEECWTACVSEYGEMVLAIDFYYEESENGEGECWCSDECNCLADAGIDNQVLVTADWLEELPQVCEEYDYTEDEIESAGVNWGSYLGYCSAENEIELSAVVYTPEECWTACVSEYGEMV